MMELLLEFNRGDPSIYSKMAEIAATNSEAEGKWRRARTYWGHKAKWHQMAGEDAERLNAEVCAAETYVRDAESRISGENSSYLAAAMILPSAIEAYQRP